MNNHRLDYRGGYIGIVDDTHRRAIEPGERVTLPDGRAGVVTDRCEGSFVFHYLVAVGGRCERIKTDQLVPNVNP